MRWFAASVVVKYSGCAVILMLRKCSYFAANKGKPMPDKLAWNAESLNLIAKYLEGRSLVAFQLFSVDHKTKAMDCLPMIIGDKRGPLTAEERASINKSFGEYLDVVRKIFGVTVINPMDAWKNATIN